MITVNGPDWPSTERLRARLANSILSGHVTWGGAQDKLEQLELLHDAGLSAVEFNEDRRYVIGRLNLGEMWWGRKRRHSQGTDIQLPWKNGRVGGMLRQKWLSSDYWVRFEPSVDEWRIHIVDGRSVARGRKVHSQPSTRTALVRSRRNGWHQTHSDSPTDEMRVLAKQACKACGLDVAAVDILVKENGDLVVLELNLAPSLRDDYTLEAYARAFERRLASSGG